MWGNKTAQQSSELVVSMSCCVWLHLQVGSFTPLGPGLLLPLHHDNVFIAFCVSCGARTRRGLHTLPRLRSLSNTNIVAEEHRAAQSGTSAMFFLHVHLGIQIPGACGDFGSQTFSVLMRRFLANLFGGGRARSLSRFNVYNFFSNFLRTFLSIRVPSFFSLRCLSRSVR